MRRKFFAILLGLAAGLSAIVAATKRSTVVDGDCYASKAAPSTPTICN